MNDHESNPQRPDYRERGWDRRSRTGIEPPPFMTRNGLVTIERRSPFDRRACWVREFSPRHRVPPALINPGGLRCGAAGNKNGIPNGWSQSARSD